MKRDLYNHKEQWKAWKKNLTDKYIEPELTKENSKLYVQYLLDMEDGANIPKNSKKGGRTPETLNRLRSKTLKVLRMVQDIGINDVSKADERKVTKLFSDWGKDHSPDYAKRFKAFWHWWMTVNRRKGKLIVDITEDISTTSNGKPIFVWIAKKQLKDYSKYFNENQQLILLFCFDSIIRAPTELLSLKVENIYTEGNEVWVDIPDEISKTIGRRFNLVYCGDALLKYIKDEKLKPQNYLFNFSPPAFNRKMQQVAKQLYGEDRSKGGELYRKISLYDMRHSGAIHFRRLFKETGQSLDGLRHRGGWTDFKMINYYTQLLGLDGKIDKKKTLLQEDKTEIEKKIEILEKNYDSLIQQIKFSGGDVIEFEIPDGMTPLQVKKIVRKLK